MVTKKIYHKLFGSTFGHIAFAAFFLAVLSGVVLIVFYDIGQAYDSIALLITANPAANYIRNLHFWSGQIFLVFTLLHIWDHLRLSTERKVKQGIWLRLTLALIAVFFVMLSGFLLKADADGLQARHIIDRLLQVFGASISFSVLGKPGDLQVVYVHHVATTTIFLGIVIVEHAKSLWPESRTLLYTVLFGTFLALFFPAGLHDPLNPVIKGPWYFVGLQEILRYITSPVFVLSFLLFLLLLIFLLPRFKEIWSQRLKYALLALSVVYLILTLVGFFFRGENGRFVVPWHDTVKNGSGLTPFKSAESYFSETDSVKNIPIILGRREGCLYCHGSVSGLSKSHDPAAIGCASCHLGNPLTLKKELAHSGMVTIPGNLSQSRRTCGTSACHPGISERVQRSLMHTMSGIITVDRFVFDEGELTDAPSNIDSIGNSAADSHLKNLCASCHIGQKKKIPGPIDQLSRGGGCNACHLQYNEASRRQLKNYIRDKKSVYNIHPQLTIQAGNEHCFGCHSRSGRIALNYEGWHETQLDSLPAGPGYRLLQDGRVLRFVAEDVHHQKGLACIDCHTSAELMGDGLTHAHESGQEKVGCTDCHVTGKPNTVTVEDLDSESLKIARLRNMAQQGRRYLITQKEHIPLINTRVSAMDSLWLIGKISGRIYPLRPPADICTRGTVHDALSCSSCHTAWAPQCVGCHTAYEPDKMGVDHLTDKKTRGRWSEWVGTFFAEAPTLGVGGDALHREIRTFIPGMILTIDASSFPGGKKQEIFKRLFAPASAHTISARGRSCVSCHNNPLALGYGHGRLEYVKSGRYGHWRFTPEYAPDDHDGLPQDAWIGFLREGKKPYSTRVTTRPFNVSEQKKILRVGACLTCHKGNSPVMHRALDNFDVALKSVSSKCVLPEEEEVRVR